jgi:hypothetical protein
VDKDDGFGGNPRAPTYDSVAGPTAPYKHVQYPKPWVGLTDEEVRLLLDDEIDKKHADWLNVCRAIEAKLKEKNCG